jgi:hypothetical protein
MHVHPRVVTGKNFTTPILPVGVVRVDYGIRLKCVVVDRLTTCHCHITSSLFITNITSSSTENLISFVLRTPLGNTSVYVYMSVRIYRRMCSCTPCRLVRPIVLVFVWVFQYFNDGTPYQMAGCVNIPHCSYVC